MSRFEDKRAARAQGGVAVPAAALLAGAAVAAPLDPEELTEMSNFGPEATDLD